MPPRVHLTESSMMWFDVEMYTSSSSGKYKSILHPCDYHWLTRPLNHQNWFYTMKNSISSQQHERFEPFMSILKHTMHRALVQLGVFGVIAEAVFIQAPVTTSWGAILHTEAENVQASWSLGNKAFSSYNALRIGSNELHSPQKCEYGKFFGDNKNNPSGYNFLHLTLPHHWDMLPYIFAVNLSMYTISGHMCNSSSIGIKPSPNHGGDFFCDFLIETNAEKLSKER